MGCDIKLHVEIKINNREGWLHWSQPRVKRNYKLFTKMANVRPSDEVEIIPISEPKGFPPELITETTLFHFEYDREDAHSISWLDSNEIVLCQKWCDEMFPSESDSFDNQFGYLLGNSLNIHEFPENYLRSGIIDVRFIFWFMG